MLKETLYIFKHLHNGFGAFSLGTTVKPPFWGERRGRWRVPVLDQVAFQLIQAGNNAKFRFDTLQSKLSGLNTSHVTCQIANDSDVTTRITKQLSWKTYFSTHFSYNSLNLQTMPYAKLYQICTTLLNFSGKS